MKSYFHLHLRKIEPGSRDYRFRVPAWLLYGAGTIGLVGLLATTLSFGYSLLLSRKLANYYDLKEKAALEDAYRHDFDTRVLGLERKIQVLLEKEQQLKSLLGLSPRVRSQHTSLDDFSENPKTWDGLSGIFPKLDSKVTSRSKEMDGMIKHVYAVRKLMAQIPSTWPIRGPLVSFFGYRTYPWSGMHTGVDIDSVYGAPVRATATGIVTYAGWKHGYGNTVILQHGKGFETLYGHNSRLAVAVGQHIEKGQTICTVGSTGLSTGTHLHYEVRRFGVPINPIAYLNLGVARLSRILSGTQSL